MLGQIELMVEIAERMKSMIEESEKTIKGHNQLMPKVVGTFKEQVQFNNNLMDRMKK